MKYSNEVIINQPLDRVIELFDNPDNLKYWQEGFVSYEHLSGEPGQPGSKARLIYKMGKREVEMIETVTERDLPDSFSCTYETKGVYNTLKNRFIALDENTTRWVAETEFRFSGWMMKLMAFFMPGSFRKQSQKFMDEFKKFAEAV